MVGQRDVVSLPSPSPDIDFPTLPLRNTVYAVEVSTIHPHPRSVGHKLRRPRPNLPFLYPHASVVETAQNSPPH